jgi:hypothetical protein
VLTSTLMELMVYPAIYTIWKWRWEVKPALARVVAGDPEDLKAIKP